MLLKRNKSIRIREKQSFTDFLTVVPAVLLLLLITYYPIASLINISFTDWNLISDKIDYVGLKNWSWLFGSKVGTRYLTNSLLVTLLYTVGQLGTVIIGGLLFALLYKRLTRPFALMRALVFMPRYIAMSTAGIIFLWMMSTDYGIFNQFLQIVGLQKVPWLDDRKIALISVIILTSWHGIGYCMMIYLSAMLGISHEYYEASSLDGATSFQTFRYITFPLLSPTTLFLFVTTFISSMKVYQSVDVLTGGGPFGATEVMVYYIYRLAFVDFRIDRAAVNALLFFLILLAVTVSTMRISNKNVHYDA